MQAKQLVSSSLVALVLTLGCVSAAAHSAELRSENGETQMHTNIAVLNSKDALEGFTGGKHGKEGLTIVDPTALLNQAPVAKLDDIEEDPQDPFITTRSGKRRPMLVENADDWADEAPVAKMPKHVLSRVKRCGDDDGDANRSRRSRRARRARRARARRAKAERRAARKANASKTTTTVTRKVIQNGQVISETREGGPVVASAAAAPATSTVVQQPVAVAPQQPVVVQQPAVAGAVPSISVQGSIKVN